MVVNMLKLIMLLLISVSLVTKTSGQASSTATATVTIATPAATLKTSDLDFGNFSGTVQAGQVEITSDGSRIVSGGVKLLSSSDKAGAASFKISSRHHVYAISLPSEDMTVINGQGTDVIKVSSFNSRLSIGTFESENVTVGATLKTSPSQKPGIYTCSNIPLQVIFHYN
ncbi:MAG: hypothetical protein JWQ96_124 [Segetibacter sp.]|nr:hypothetical protein [Segetibacter sp.]